MQGTGIQLINTANNRDFKQEILTFFSFLVMYSWYRRNIKLSEKWAL